MFLCLFLQFTARDIDGDSTINANTGDNVTVEIKGVTPGFSYGALKIQFLGVRDDGDEIPLATQPLSCEEDFDEFWHGITLWWVRNYATDPVRCGVGTPYYYHHFHSLDNDTYKSEGSIEAASWEADGQKWGYTPGPSASIDTSDSTIRVYYSGFLGLTNPGIKLQVKINQDITAIKVVIQNHTKFKFSWCAEDFERTDTIYLNVVPRENFQHLHNENYNANTWIELSGPETANVDNAVSVNAFGELLHNNWIHAHYVVVYDPDGKVVYYQAVGFSFSNEFDKNITFPVDKVGAYTVEAGIADRSGAHGWLPYTTVRMDINVTEPPAVDYGLTLGYNGVGCPGGGCAMSTSSPQGSCIACHGQKQSYSHQRGCFTSLCHPKGGRGGEPYLSTATPADLTLQTNFSAGNVYARYQITHINSPAGLSSSLCFSYNSLDTNDYGLGQGWTHNFGMTITASDEFYGYGEGRFSTTMPESYKFKDWDGKQIDFVNPSQTQDENYIYTSYSSEDASGYNTTLIVITDLSTGEFVIAVLTKHDGTTLYFNKQGKLTRKENLARQGSNVVYYADRTEIIDDSDHTTTLHKSNGQVTSITDNAGNNVDLEQTNGKLTKITKHDGAKTYETTFSYNPYNGEIATVTTPEGHTTEFGYNSPEPVTITQPAGGVIQIEYNYSITPAEVRVTNTRGYTTVYKIDRDLNTWLERTDPNGYTITRTYDNFRNLTQQVNAHGFTTR